MKTYLCATPRHVFITDDGGPCSVEMVLQRVDENGEIKTLPLKKNFTSKKEADEGASEMVKEFGLITAKEMIERISVKNVDIDIDEEEGIDYESAANELLEWEPSNDTSVEVLDGFNIHDITDFPSLSAESIRRCIIYIEEHDLQYEAPWSLVHHLWKCLQAKGQA